MAKLNRIMTATGFAAAGLIGASLLLAGMSTAAPHSDDRAREDKVAPRCLDSQNIGRKHVVDENTLLVYDDFGNAYKLGIGGPCRTMDDWSKIGFEFDGNAQICDAHDAKILYSRWDEPPVRCIINSVERLTKAQAAEIDKDY